MLYATALLCFSFPLCRSVGFWLSRTQSLLYCNEHGVLGSFSEEVKSCSCPVEQPTCQGVIPCIVGTSPTSCSSCATDNATRCGACHHGNILHLGSCQPSIAASLDHYLNFDLDMPDAEVIGAYYICIPLVLKPLWTRQCSASTCKDYMKNQKTQLLVSLCLNTNADNNHT